MSDEEESLIMKRIFEYESSPGQFSNLVETYCAEYGRDRVRPYLIPIQRSSSGWSDVDRDSAKNLNIANKSLDTNRASSSKSDKNSPIIVVCDDEICGVKNHIKNVSPDGSITSRKLEWDSLADIGYANEDQNKDSQTKPLSTLERIALNHHRNNVLTVDFKDQVSIKYERSFGSPVAQSTPVSPIVKPTEEKHTSKTSKPFVSHPCKLLKCNRRYRHRRQNSTTDSKKNLIYSVRVKINKSKTLLKPSNAKSINRTVQNLNSTDSAKYSSKSSNITINTTSSVIEESNKFVQHSNSNRTVNTTPVTEERNEFIDQPSYSNQTVDTTSPDTEERNKLIEQLKNSPLYDTESNEIDNISPKYDSSKIPSIESETNSSSNGETNLFGTDSIVNTETSQPATEISNDYNMNNFSTVDSFEFIPGNKYSKKNIQSSTNSSSIRQSNSENNSEIPRQDSFQPSTSKRDLIDNQKLNDLTSSEIIQNVSSNSLNSICRLVESKHSDPKLKKRLVKKIIQLLTAEYIGEECSKTSDETTSSTKPPSKNYAENECQTDADLIPNSVETIKKSIPNLVNIENPKTFDEKSYNESETIDKSVRTLQNSSGSYSSTYEDFSKEKNRNRLLKKEKIIKKMADLEQKKKDLPRVRSNHSNDPEKDLAAINNKILNLLILKYKLENADSVQYSDLTCDKTASKKSDSQSSEFQTIENLNLENESESRKSCHKVGRKSKKDIHIPPLNLKISSDDSDVLSDNAKLPLSNQSDYKNKHEPFKISSEKDKLSYLSKEELSKISIKSCSCNPTSKSCCSCKSNVVSESQSSGNSEPIEYKVNRLKETYSKYQKCHVLQKFLKEYDKLIEKYQKRKTSPSQEIIKSQDSTKKISESENIDSKSGKNKMENATSRVDKQHEISSKQTSVSKNETRKAEIQPEISSRRSSITKDMDSKNGKNDMEKARSEVETQSKMSSKRSSVSKSIDSKSERSDVQKLASQAEIRPEISSRRSSIFKSVDSKSERSDAEKTKSEDGIQSEISSKRSSVAKSIDSKSKAISLKKAHSLSETLSDKNEFSQANNTNNENITKSEIKDPMIKEIFTFMEKIERMLNENSLIRKQETSKISTGVQITSLPQDSEEGASTSKHTLPKSKSPKIQDNDYVPQNNTESISQPKTNSESQNRRPKPNTIDNCLVCVNNHLKHQKCKQLCLCSKALRHRRRKEYPKPIAYNLILESSSNIMVDSNNLKTKRVLDEIVVKVPKLNYEDRDEALRQLKEKSDSATQFYFDIKKSSRDQSKKLSSSNDDSLSDQFDMTIEIITPRSSHSPLTSNEIIDSCSSENKQQIRKNTRTVEDYLVMNRPKFVTDANKRLESLKKYNSKRKEYEDHKRKFFEENLLNPNEFSTKNFHYRYSKNITIPENLRLFDAKEIVKKSALRYKKLPEVQKQKEILKKQMQSKTNRLIAKIFVKKLQQNALKGVVNISHFSNVISL